MEIWKDIKGYEGYYKVSNLGNIKRIETVIRYKNNGLRNYPAKVLKQEKIMEGYLRVVLMKEAVKKRFMSHRLVAEAFIPNTENKPFVNHINGNPNDNRVENLEWCTQSENEKHSINILGKTMKGKTTPKKIKCIENDNACQSVSIN